MNRLVKDYISKALVVVILLVSMIFPFVSSIDVQGATKVDANSLYSVHWGGSNETWSYINSATTGISSSTSTGSVGYCSSGESGKWQSNDRCYVEFVLPDFTDYLASAYFEITFATTDYDSADPFQLEISITSPFMGSALSDYNKTSHLMYASNIIGASGLDPSGTIQIPIGVMDLQKIEYWEDDSLCISVHSVMDRSGTPTWGSGEWEAVTFTIGNIDFYYVDGEVTPAWEEDYYMALTEATPSGLTAVWQEGAGSVMEGLIGDVPKLTWTDNFPDVTSAILFPEYWEFQRSHDNFASVYYEELYPYSWTYEHGEVWYDIFGWFVGEPDDLYYRVRLIMENEDYTPWSNIATLGDTELHTTTLDLPSDPEDIDDVVGLITEWFGDWSDVAGYVLLVMGWVIPYAIFHKRHMWLVMIIGSAIMVALMVLELVDYWLLIAILVPAIILLWSKLRGGG